jgi:hypothetical protein
MAILKDQVWHGCMVQRVRDIVCRTIQSMNYGDPLGTIEEMAVKIERQSQVISLLAEQLYANGAITTEQLGELVGNPELRQVER